MRDLGTKLKLSMSEAIGQGRPSTKAQKERAEEESRGTTFCNTSRWHPFTENIMETELPSN